MVEVASLEELEQRLRDRARTIERTEIAFGDAQDEGERAQLGHELEELRALQARTQARADKLLEEVGAAYSEGPPPETPATRDARQQLAEMERDGAIEPWQVTQLQAVLAEVEGAFVEAQAKMADALELALNQAREVAEVRRESERKLTVSERIEEWSRVKVLRRGSLDAAQKSQIIRRFGQAAYLSLKP